MAKHFIVRVELHGVAAEDYGELHAAMEAQRFARTVMDGNVRKKLPTGTYLAGGIGDTAEAAKDRAVAAASDVLMNVGYTSSIVVAETDAPLQFEGLQDDKD